MQHEALRLVRQFHNLTLSELSNRLEVSKSFLSQVEHGHKKPSLELLEQYAATFKMPLSSLLLFAENFGSPTPSARIRTAIAGKTLRMLQWVEEVTRKEGEEENV